MKEKAVFLDRDGTLNRDSLDYIKNLAEFELFDYTPEALKILKELGFKLIIITNQSVIARGMASTEEVEEIHDYLKKYLYKEGIKIDGIYYCPHHPEENCDCRKPNIGNIDRAIKDFNIDPLKSYFVGDSKRDIEAGKRAGCKTIMLLSGERIKEPEEIKSWNIKPDYIEENLLTAAMLIRRLESSG
ncbi:MAG: D-glycero-beta-D-manno-heptose 1,7-bisphosphate 7-phosphatase [Candidatus Marinimicrobia bacterium]|nr:D-glycero-beta-D-manno-heptose 1,7-bisphosphate 7-phosphatase [Candidatus Neomarinimicrobiota bacterium]